eukprot:UN01249
MASVDTAGQGQVNSLYVAKLPESINESELFNLFNDANNPITSLRIVRNAEHKPCYGYLNFNTPEQALAVLKQSNFKVHDGVEIVLAKNAKPAQYDPNANIYTSGQFPAEIRTKLFYDYYCQFGEVASLQVRNKPEKTSIYVQFETVEAAQAAIEATKTELTLEGQTYAVKTEVFKPRAQREQKFTNVFVRNFPINFTQEQFQELASKYGTVTSVFMPERFPTKPGTTSPSPTGYAFANYQTPEDAQHAIEKLCEETIGDFKLQAFPAKDKDTRKREVESSTTQYRQTHPKTAGGANRSYQNGPQNGPNGQQQRYPARKIRIRNLPQGMELAELSKKVQPFGPVNNIRIFAAHNTAIVEFQTPQAAEKAMRGLVQEWQVSYYYNFRRFHNGPYHRRYAPNGYGQRFRSRRMMPHAMPPGPGYFGPNGYPQPQYGMVPNQYFQQYPHPAGQPIPGGAAAAPGQQQTRYRSARQARGANNQNPAAAGAAGAQQQAVAQVAAPQDAPLSDDERQQVGSRLYYAIQPLVGNDPDLTGKITGMLLELPPVEVRHLAQDTAVDMLTAKVNEARAVLMTGPQ